MTRLPRWTNKVFLLALLLAVTTPVYLVTVLALATSPAATEVGYRPIQPVAFSHALHAGDLAIDCRYCHDTVERAAHAAVPPTSTCMNCHARIHPESAALAPIRESWADGTAVPWVKIHDLPDFVYFDHSAHVNRGVGCVSCHGRIDRMEVVEQAKPLSMSWCLDCHREPDRHLRPLDEITDMTWEPEIDPAVLGARLRRELGISPSTDCSTCHR